MSQIHFIGGEKGGVGKSLVARVLAQYFIDHDLSFLGFDTDRSHGALMRFYSGYASPVLVDRYEALDAIMEAAVEQPQRRILVDLAAQTHDPLVRWMDDSGVLNLADEMNVKIHYWHVMDSGKDSVDLLRKLLDRFGTSLNLGPQPHSRQRLQRARAIRRTSPRHRDGRQNHVPEKTARQRHPKSRRRQQQLLESQNRQRRPGPGADGSPAGQDVAAGCVSGFG
jgi:hypothetical protein